MREDLARWMRLSSSRNRKHLYWVQCQVTQNIKIGCSDNPAKRFKHLQGMSPTPLKMLAILTNGGNYEEEWHEALAEWRLHGEWFSPSPEVVASVGVKP